MLALDIPPGLGAHALVCQDRLFQCRRNDVTGAVSCYSLHLIIPLGGKTRGRGGGGVKEHLLLSIQLRETMCSFETKSQKKCYIVYIC